MLKELERAGKTTFYIVSLMKSVCHDRSKWFSEVNAISELLALLAVMF